MGLAFVVLTDGDEARIAEVVAFAQKPENYYNPDPSNPPTKLPEGNRATVAWFRCAFTITVAKSAQTGTECLIRHLSITKAMDWGGPLPSPAEVALLAPLFGFKGSYLDWQIGIPEGQDFVGVVQGLDALPPNTGLELVNIPVKKEEVT